MQKPPHMQSRVYALGLLLLLGCWPALGRAQAVSASASASGSASSSEVVAAAETSIDGDSEPEPDSKPGDTLTLGLFGGVVVPRSGLGVAPTVGLEGIYGLTPELRLFGAVDWALLARQHSELLSPPQYPRSLGNLIQNTHVVTVAAGAGYKLLAVGDGELVGAGALLLSVTSTTFDVYDTHHVDGDVGPGLEAQLALAYPLGPLRLRVHVAYREVLHDFGASGPFGDDVVSAFLAGAGLGLAL